MTTYYPAATPRLPPQRSPQPTPIGPEFPGSPGWRSPVFLWSCPSNTDRLNHRVEESHDDVIHHVPGIDCFALPARGSPIGVEYTSQIQRQSCCSRMIEAS